MPSVRFPTSEVVIYETQGNGVILLVKKSSDQKYYLFLINSINGAITFDGIDGSSVFDTKLQALKTMQANYVLSKDKNPIVGQALVGAARYGPVLYVLVVKQSNAIARIQNAHTIFSVTETEFYRINLHFHPPLTQQEQRRIDRIVEFPVAEYHMWCETKDLTVPLYSDQHDSSFLWNKHWTKSFEDLGQKDACINLLQGTAISQLIYLNPSIRKPPSTKINPSQQISDSNQTAGDNQNQENNISISKSAPSIARTSSYLDDLAPEPTPSFPQDSIDSSTNLPNPNFENKNQANEEIPPQNTDKNNLPEQNGMFYRFTIISIRESANGGTRYYARGLDDDHHPANEVQVHIIVESNDGKLWSHVWRRGSIPVKWSTIIAKNIPTVSISIQPDSGKDTHFYFDYLKTFYPENIQIINLLHNQPTNSEFPLCVAYQNSVERLSHVQYYEFDLHKETKEKGISGAVKLLYCYLQDIEFTYSETETNIPISINLENIGSEHEWDTSYMINPIPIIYFPNEISSPNSKTKLNLAENENVVLPEFGTTFSKIQKSTVRINCMDSLDRTNVVSFFYAIKVISKILEDIGICQPITTFEELMNLPNSIRSFICEAFMNIGDCVSYLYTNTPACMTEIFHEVAQDDIKTKSDSSIAVKRRYHNFLTDRKRQKAYNMFLGKCFEIHIPNIDCSPLPLCVSMGSSQFMQPFLNDGKSIIDPTNLLQISSFTINSVGCKAAIMMLSEVCYVTDIYMIISPPNPPSSVSISSSLTFGIKTPLVEKVAFPTVTKPQPIRIKIPPDMNNFELNMMRFLIFEFDCRALNSHGKAFQSDLMTISNIFVFGHRTCDHELIENYYNFLYQQLPKPDEKSNRRRENLSKCNNITCSLSAVSISFSSEDPHLSSLISEDSIQSNSNSSSISQNSIIENHRKSEIITITNNLNPLQPKSGATESAHRNTITIPHNKSLDLVPSDENLPLNSSSSTFVSGIVETPDEFQSDIKSTPKEFLKTIKRGMPFDYITTIHYEDTRINHHMGRLKSLKIAALNGFNPLDITMTKQFRNVPEIDANQNTCSVCGSVSSWECFLCQKHFCKNKGCSKQNYFNDAFYFKQSSVVCDSCAITLKEYKKEFDNLFIGYKTFNSLENPKEGEVNNFVTSFINNRKQKEIEKVKQERFRNKTIHSGYIKELSFEQRKQQILHKKIEEDPSKFPNAFFIDTQNPSFNLLLTDEGSSITSEEWGKKYVCFSLGCHMDLSAIIVKGSDDCRLKITKSEGLSIMMDLLPNIENRCQDFSGRLFSICLEAGTLNSIYVKGKEIQRTLISQKVVSNCTVNPPKWKFLKAKNLHINYHNRIISTDLGKNKNINGVVLQNFTGIHSILIEIFKGSENLPFKVIKRFLPDTDEGNDFLVLFKKQVNGSRVDVQIIDAASIKEPKVMLI